MLLNAINHSIRYDGKKIQGHWDRLDIFCITISPVKNDSSPLPSIFTRPQAKQCAQIALIFGDSVNIFHN